VFARLKSEGLSKLIDLGAFYLSGNVASVLSAKLIHVTKQDSCDSSVTSLQIARLGIRRVARVIFGANVTEDAMGVGGNRKQFGS
jgi:hypothetical protein